MFGADFIIRGVIALCFAAAVAWGVHSYNSWIRAPLEQKYEAREKELVQRTTDITNMMSDRLMKEMDRAKAAEALALLRFQELAKRADGISPSSRVLIPADVAGVSIDAASAANAGRTDGGGKEGTQAVPQVPPADSGTTLVFDGREVARFVVDASEAYNDAFLLWQSCRAREDVYIEAFKRGQSK